MSAENEQKLLYIFIDEAGNFDFTPTGTKYFVLTAVSTMTPLKNRECFLRLRYNLLENGINIEYFHASEEKQDVRNLVFEAIKEMEDIQIDAVLAQKNKTNPSLYIQYEPCRGKAERRDPFTGGPGVGGWKEMTFKPIRSEELFYDKISQILLQYIFGRHERKNQIEKIVVVLGSLFTKAKREYVLKSLKRYLKSNFRKQFYIYFHTSVSDINCQIADYCGWVVYVRAERGETRPWEAIRGRVKSHFDVFARGDTEYYEYKK